MMRWYEMSEGVGIADYRHAWMNASAHVQVQVQVQVVDDARGRDIQR